ncbi:MAG TPA: urate oxidase [Candidatus Sulfotelmatobacter sp.]|nr:urate oxidase [Candidatus Sulfotelmatobacter sp.]
MKLVHHQYGKARVRVTKVAREGSKHSLKELELAVSLQGDFDASYTKADNRLVIATDSMKNTINVLAKQKLADDSEEFGLALGEHFLKTYPQVTCAEIAISEKCWERMSANGKPHPHAFQLNGAIRRVSKIAYSRKEHSVESGVEGLNILKTTQSGFENFVRDRFTTLPETRDRILATELRAIWTYEKTPKSYSATNGKILHAMLRVFANDYSPSAQATLFQMGEAALKAAREISKIKIAMPNKHCLLINLAPFGLENKNELFVPLDEPHGQIEGTVGR